jgi:predicted MFS family arabinose efflux permease
VNGLETNQSAVAASSALRTGYSPTLEADAPKAAAPTRFGPGYRAALLLLILLASAFAFVDRIIIQTLAQPIKEDLGLTDFQLGILGGLSFALLYSTLGLPIARMAERRDRITIVSVSVAIFSLFSFLCGTATNFLQLFLYRVGVGVGEAGVQAPSTSLIGDHFPPHRRGFALTIMRLGAPLGAVFGSVLAGWIAKDHGWRVAMMAICGPGLLVALLFRLVLRDPPRGLSDPHPAEPGNHAATGTRKTTLVIGEMLRNPMFRHMLIGLGLTNMALYASGAFLAPFYMRVHGLGLAMAGVFLAISTSASSALGMSLGGFGIDAIARRGQHWYAKLPLWGLLISVPLFLMGYSNSHALTGMILITLASVFVFFHAVPTLVAFQNMVAPAERTTAAFVYFFVATLVGVGFGPPVIGLLSDAYASCTLPNFASLCSSPKLTGACAAASASGVQAALVTSVGLYAWAAVHYWLAARAIAREARA